ncbi:clathrin adaptor, mu subunit [Macrolepiota fuliginosa MF-IS2]|uniref:Clathrin adaptor, mu subunit n=1 Tax=Macrolepiota fuliginosa MF-IS2 TaxID=1400762 RepID=A0A9P6C7K9_9AGAR|nr:clathrin adaptor, mu subunit [Macrolepiota fuliginosa MF-IS2]
MAIDGLILLDNTGRPIIQSGFRSSQPSYPLVHIDAFNNALAKAPRPSDVDPVLYVPSLTNGTPSACCHISRGDMRILCPISGDVDPIFAFAFLQTFVDILTEYFGAVSAATMRDNFDVVYQLLEETLDAGGSPLTTSPNALRDIVLPPSLLTKLLSVAGANINTTFNSGTGGPFSSSIPWRKANVRHNANEVYFDMVEELTAIVNKNGVALSSTVWGKIETNCRLSGTPDCFLSFTNPQVLTDCSFHPCVRLQRWARDKSLSFIPPDGRFILAEYRFAPAASAPTARFASPGSQAVNPTKDSVAIPFVIKPVYDLEDTGAHFDITLTSRLSTRSLENVVIQMNVGEGVGGVKCVAARGSGISRHMSAAETGMSSAMGASWAFDTKNKVLRWEIANAPPSSTWNLRGSFTTPSVKPRPSHALQIHFEIQSHTFSALKVEQLRVTGESYKPYKGVRGRSMGNVEWRW